MTPEQKQHAIALVKAWDKTAYGMHADAMAALLQELVDAPEPVPVALTWYDGEPPFPQNQEWFIAVTIYGVRVVLKALPDDHTYDYTTGDGTYMLAKNIDSWMQFPDCEYLPPKQSSTPEPEPVPVAVVSNFFTGRTVILANKDIELPDGAPLYAAPPAPSVPTDLARDAARYRWLLNQAWFQQAADRFDLPDGGLQNRFEKCMGEFIDAAMSEKGQQT